MIHVPLKKRFKLYEINGKPEKWQERRKAAPTSKDSDVEDDGTAKSYELNSVSLTRTNSPLCSDASPDSPLTPTSSSESTEKSFSWRNSSPSFLSQSSPASNEETNVIRSPVKPTAFKPYNGTKVPVENCTLEYRNPSISDYSEHLSKLRLNTSSYFGHIPFYEGIQSLASNSKSEQLHEKTSTWKIKSKCTNEHKTSERNLNLENGLKNNSYVIKEAIGKEFLPTSDSRLKRKFEDSSTVKDEYYWDKRRRNNASAKRSRDARRARELETQINFAFLHEENRKLKAEISLLREENANLRGMICTSQLSSK